MRKLFRQTNFCVYFVWRGGLLQATIKIKYIFSILDNPEFNAQVSAQISSCASQ